MNQIPLIKPDQLAFQMTQEAYKVLQEAIKVPFTSAAPRRKRAMRRISRTMFKSRAVRSIKKLL